MQPQPSSAARARVRLLPHSAAVARCCAFSQRPAVRMRETTLRRPRRASSRLDENVYELDTNLDHRAADETRARRSTAASRCGSTTRSASPRAPLPARRRTSQRCVQSYELNYHALSQRYLLRNLNTGEQFDFGSLRGGARSARRDPRSAGYRFRLLPPGAVVRRAGARACSTWANTAPDALGWLLFWTDDWSAASEWYSWTLRP